MSPDASGRYDDYEGAEVDDETLIEFPDGSRVRVQTEDLNAVRGLSD